MAGTKSGGLTARDSNYARHGTDFYKRIGKMGGAKWNRETSKPRGFMLNHDLARIAGAKGGKVSRKKKI